MEAGHDLGGDVPTHRKNFVGPTESFMTRFGVPSIRLVPQREIFIHVAVCPAQSPGQSS